MKKIISLLLAVLMAFSAFTFAFAADVDTAEPVDPPVAEEGTEEAPADGEESTIPDLGNVEWILDLPFWTVKPAAKVAKIALKLVIVYLKVAKIFGIVDKDASDYVLEFIMDAIADATEDTTTTLAPEVVPEPAPAA